MTDVLPANASDASTFYDHTVVDTPNADWALLEFIDRNTANDQELPFVSSMMNSPPQVGTACVVYGFAGGSAGFAGHVGAKSDVVTPVQPTERPRVKTVSGGLVELTGIQTSAGTSGGGVFAKWSNSLVALHRAKVGLPLELHAVSLLQILPALEEKFDFAPPEKRRTPAVALICLVLLLVGALSWWFFPGSCNVWGRYSETELASDINAYWDRNELSIKEKDLMSRNGCIAVTGLVKRRGDDRIAMEIEKAKGATLRVYTFVFISSRPIDASITSNVQVRATGRIDTVVHPPEGTDSGAFEIKVKDAEVLPQ